MSAPRLPRTEWLKFAELDHMRFGPVAIKERKPLTRRVFLSAASATFATVRLSGCSRESDGAKGARSDADSTGAAPQPHRTEPPIHSNVFPLRRPTQGRHYLETRGGQPLFLLGDTAWSIAVSASQSDVVRYLDNRKAKGFNAFTFNAIEAEFAGGNNNSAPVNCYGESPFTDLQDFTTPREQYWVNVDFIVEQAARRDMLCIIFPSYEGYGGGNQGWYRQMAAQGSGKLHRYGAWLARRYRSSDNILWVAGGDNNAVDRSLTRAVVSGIDSVSSKWLFAWHGARNTNALAYWRDDLGWLDLNTIYDSADRAAANAEASYHNSIVKPFVRIEDTYENPVVGEVSPSLIRWLAWSSALQGGTGAIYGDVAVWRFNGPGLVADPTSWQSALERPACASMQFLKQLFEAIAWTRLVPEAATAPSGNASQTTVNLTAVSEDRSFAIAYAPAGSRGLKIDLTRLSGPKVRAQWYDPTSGQFALDGMYAASGSRSFARNIPNSGGSADWALLLESQ